MLVVLLVWKASKGVVHKHRFVDLSKLESGTIRMHIRCRGLSLKTRRRAFGLTVCLSCRNRILYPNSPKP